MMSRLLLEFQEGPTRLPRIWLREGQAATVGRTAEADFSAENDRFLSSIHFRVESRGTGWWVRDLTSTNGTFVNEEKVVEATLRHGDNLRAGQTRWLVQLQDADAAPIPDASTLAAAANPLASLSPLVNDPATLAPTADVLTSVAARKNDALSVTIPDVRKANFIELLCLEVRGQPQSQKIWLPPGRTATIGCSERSELCVADDRGLAAQHFRVSCGNLECRVQELDGATETFVNDRRIRDAIVRHGDVIRAGGSEFVVEIRHENQGLIAPGSEDRYVAAMTDSGIWTYRGCEPGPSWQSVFSRLAALVPVHLIVNCADFAWVPPARPVYLLDWLNPVVAAQLSPMVLPPADAAELLPVLEAGWGKNAVTCIFSHADHAQLLFHLRTAARGQTRSAGIPLPENILGAYRPRDVTRVLTSCIPEFAEFFLSQTQGILMEHPEPPHWTLLGAERAADMLQNVGLLP